MRALTIVAAWIAPSGVMPWRTMYGSWIGFSPWGYTPESVPKAIRTPAATALRKPIRWAAVVSSFLRRVSAGQPARAPSSRDPVAVVDVGDEVGPELGEQGDPFVVDERAMLDRADAGPGGELDPLSPVGVGGDEPAACRGRLDGRLEHRAVQLDLAGLGPPGEDGAGRDHLDDVRATVAQQVDDPADVVRGPDDADPHLGRDVHARQAGHFAAAARGRHIGPGRLHPRPIQQARVDPVAELEVEERPVRADVADARDAGPQRPPGVPDADEQLALGGHPDGRRVAVLEVADEVAVPVDEPGDHGVGRRGR